MSEVAEILDEADNPGARKVHAYAGPFAIEVRLAQPQDGTVFACSLPDCATSYDATSASGGCISTLHRRTTAVHRHASLTAHVNGEEMMGVDVNLGKIREVDVVIVTAIRLEFEAVLQVDAGAVPGSIWELASGSSGLPVAFRSFVVPNHRALRIAVAIAPDMGATAAVNTLLPLVEQLRPRCLAMCGVCAGRRGKVALGDVVAADRLYYHDTGKQLPDQVQQDLTIYKLRDDWKAGLEGMDPAARFRTEPWFGDRPLTLEWREHRALVALREGTLDPWSALGPELGAGAWKRIVEGLCERGLLESSGRTLTDAGHRFVDELLFKYQNALPDLSPVGALQPFRLHVAPIGSGARVVEDERIWTFVSQAMRKTLGIEMEAAAVAEIAHRQRQHRLDWVVMKGVMDFADHGRDDHFKDFAARAAAECLLWFLRERVPTESLDVPCPYPGMRPYSADEAERFYGRSTEIDELLSRLRAKEHEIYVIGPSGSGKSSLVAAGLLPRLIRGVSGLGSFVVRSMRPGEHPVTRLQELLEGSPGHLPANAVAALLARWHPTASLLILIDQLEELFTLASANQRELFVSALRGLRDEPRCIVVFTLRADFFGVLMESPLWPEQVSQLSRVEVSPLRGEALREAISAPARNVGVGVEPALIERLIADAASEPGVLPLLQETMVQLWDKRVEQALCLADYQTLGDGDRSGLAVSVARRADATLRRFTPAQIATARRILIRLINFGEGRTDTRRQQNRAMLRASADDTSDFAHVLQQLIHDRLLTVDEGDGAGEPRVDLAHEVMISAWPTLRGWIRDHRADEQRRRHLEGAAAQWVGHGRGARGLLDPIELADAEAWQDTQSVRQMGHSTNIMALIAASQAEHTKRENEAREHAAKLADSERASRQLLAEMYMECGRQFLLGGRPREAIPSPARSRIRIRC